MQINYSDIVLCIAKMVMVIVWCSVNDPGKLTKLYHSHSIKIDFQASLGKHFNLVRIKGGLLPFAGVPLH